MSPSLVTTLRARAKEIEAEAKRLVPRRTGLLAPLPSVRDGRVIVKSPYQPLSETEATRRKRFPRPGLYLLTESD